MSEEKYEEKVLKALNLIVDQTKPQPKSEESSKHKEEAKEDAIVHIDTCPTCRNKFKEKLRPEILTEQREKHKKIKSPKLCEDCGEILDGEENKDCPNCHGHNY